MATFNLEPVQNRRRFNLEPVEGQGQQRSFNLEPTSSRRRFNLEPVQRQTYEGLGEVSARYESGGDPGRIGLLDGGSYGTWQLNGPTLQDFIGRAAASQNATQQDIGRRLSGSPGTHEFNQEWHSIAREMPDDFQAMQRDYITQTHFEPAAQMFEQAGVPVRTMPRNVQEAIFSRSVQLGVGDVGRPYFERVIASLPQNPTNQQVIDALYDESLAQEGQSLRYFGGSSRQVQEGVRNRLERERGEVSAMQPEGAQDAPSEGFGVRSDGSEKGLGYFGVLQRPDGDVSTELSIGVEIDGEEVELPLLVPGLSREQIDHLLDGNEPSREIVDIAVEHAMSRRRQGLSPFAQDGEQQEPPQRQEQAQQQPYTDMLVGGMQAPRGLQVLQGEQPPTQEDARMDAFARAMRGEAVPQVQAELRAAPEQTFLDRVRSIFEDTEAQDDRAAMAVAVAEEIGSTPSAVMQNFDEVSRQLGMRGELTNSEYLAMVLTSSLPFAAASKPIQFLVGLGVFEGVDFSIEKGLQAATGDENVQDFSDLLSPSTSQWARDTVDAAQLLAEMAAAGGAIRGAGRARGVFENIRASQWWREATIRERGLAVQSTADAIRAMRESGMSDGEILRVIKRTAPESPEFQSLWNEVAVETGRVAREGEARRPAATQMPTAAEPEAPRAGEGPIAAPEATGEAGARTISVVQEEPSVAPEQRGANTTVRHPGGQEEAAFEVVDASDIAASHDATAGFAPNQRYDYVNERDYTTDAEEREKVIRRSLSTGEEPFDPGFLLDAPDATQGAPVISRTGSVLGGNSRKMIIDLIYQQNPNAAESYRQAIRDFAEQQGIDPAVVDSMERPMLVRRLSRDITPEEAQRLITKYNEDFKQQVEQGAEAVSRGRLVSQDTANSIANALADYDTLREFLDTDAAIGIVDRLIADGAINRGERGRILNRTGQGLSPDGKNFVERILRGTIIQDYEVMRNIPSSIIGKIDRIVPFAVRLRNAEGEWNVQQALIDAIELYRDFKASNFRTVDEYIRTPKMVNANRSLRNPRVRTMLRALANMGPVDFAKAWRAFAAMRDVATQGIPGMGMSAADAFEKSFVKAKKAGKRGPGEAAVDREPPKKPQKPKRRMLADEEPPQPPKPTERKARAKPATERRKGRGLSAEEYAAKIEKEFQKAREGFSPRPDVPKPIPLQLSDLVEFARLVSEGKFPRVVKKIGRTMDVRGAFYPSGRKIGGIEIARHTFNDPEQILKTLAHEIGHLNDWIAGERGINTISRGNILGRIAGLIKNSRRYIPGWPGGPKPLTRSEMDKLRRLARKLEQGGERWIDEEIERRTDLTPKDILDVWNNFDAVHLLPEEFLNYVKGLSNAEKKALVIQAMRGLVPEELKRFARVEKILTGKKVKIEIDATDEDVLRRFRELLADEVIKRGVLARDAIQNELVELTNIWKPYEIDMDTPEGRKYHEYRMRPEELFADGWSAFLVDPALLERIAPTFMDALQRYLSSRPSVADAWTSIQNDIATQGSLQSLRRRRMDRVQAATIARSVAVQKKASSHWVQSLLEPRYSLMKIVEKKTPELVGTDQDPTTEVNNVFYRRAGEELYNRRFIREVIDPLRDAGITMQMFDEYMSANRVAYELNGRAAMGGMTQEQGRAILNDIKENTPDKFRLLEEARNRWVKLRHDLVLEPALDSQIYPQATMEYLIMNDDYAAIIKSVEDESTGAVKALLSQPVRELIGSFGDQINVLVAGPIKDAMFMNMVAVNRANKAITRYLAKYAKNEVTNDGVPFIEKAKKDRSGRPIEPSNSAQVLMAYRSLGKTYGFYVPKEIGDVMVAARGGKPQGVALQRANQFMNFFKNTWVTFSLPFMIRNVIFRDPRDMVKKLPGMTGLLARKYQIRAMQSSWNRLRNNPDAVIDEMLMKKMLVAESEFFGFNPTANTRLKAIERQLITNMEQLPDGSWRIKNRNKYLKLMKELALFFPRAMRELGAAGETNTKVAGYMYLNDFFPDMPEAEKIRLVREGAGSPDFPVKAQLARSMDALFPFIPTIIGAYRTHFYAGKRDWKHYLWKVMRWNGPISILKYAISAGLLGSGLQYLYSYASPYKMQTSMPIPVGFDNQTELPIFLYLPNSEIDTMFETAMTTMIEGAMNPFGDPTSTAVAPEYMAALESMLNYGTPSFSPYVDIVKDLGDMMAGHAPYDHFRGRPAWSDDIQRAGGTELAVTAMRYFTNKYFGAQIYLPDRPARNDLERFYRIPIVGPTARAFVRADNYGQIHGIYNSPYLQEYQRNEARAKVLADQALERMAAGDVDWASTEEAMADEQFMGLLEHYRQPNGEINWNAMMEQFMRVSQRRGGSALAAAISRASSNEEKVQIFFAYTRFLAPKFPEVTAMFDGFFFTAQEWARMHENEETE